MSKMTFHTLSGVVFFAAMCWHGMCQAQAMSVQPKIWEASVEAKVVGPMAGAVTMRSARIWAQLPSLPSAGRVPVRMVYQALDAAGQPTGMAQETQAVLLSSDRNSHIWTVEQLQPGTRYQYKLVWGKGRQQKTSPPYSFKTESLWQWRTDPPALRILASSCAYTNDEQEDRPGRPYGQSNVIYESMASRQPDVTLWMGDNVYLREPDFDDRAAMAQRYDKWRALPELQALLQTGRHLATWDDHDYGVNDSNASNPFKATALALFQQYWANPSYGLPDLPGVFTQHRSSDVEFFMLDDRWYRDSDKLIDEDKQLYGAAQLRWLKNALLSSTATWKLVVTAGQVLNLNNRYEGWNRFEKESQQFLSWLDKQKVPGVMLMSGDRHFSVLLKQERSGTYPLYELTCSPSTAGAYQNPEEDLKDNQRIVPGSVVTQSNFCELEVTGKRGQRTLNITMADRQGQKLFEKKITEQELR